MVKLVVILLELYLPSGCAGADFMGFTPIGKISVIGPDDDGYGSSSKEM